jgi:hypothetical protein
MTEMIDITTEQLHYQKYIKYKIKYLNLLNYKYNLEGGKGYKNYIDNMLFIITIFFKFLKKMFTDTTYKNNFFNDSKNKTNLTNFKHFIDTNIKNQKVFNNIFTNIQKLFDFLISLTKTILLKLKEHINKGLISIKKHIPKELTSIKKHIPKELISIKKHIPNGLTPIQKSKHLLLSNIHKGGTKCDLPQEINMLFNMNKILGRSLIGVIIGVIIPVITTNFTAATVIQPELLIFTPLLPFIKICLPEFLHLIFNHQEMVNTIICDLQSQ